MGVPLTWDVRMWQGKKKCSCKDNYMGDGITCELKQLAISRCLQNNGRCHQNAKCTDLHFEGKCFGQAVDNHMSLLPDSRAKLINKPKPALHLSPGQL